MVARTLIDRARRVAAKNEFVKIYRDAGQTEEEDKCLAQVRRMNRKLARPNGWQFVNPFAWAVHDMLAYAEMLLGGFSRIAGAFVVWRFAFVFWFIDKLSARVMAMASMVM